MPEELSVAIPGDSTAAIKHWAAFLAKAAVLAGLLWLFSRYAGRVPSWGIALLWALLSVISAVGITYRRVMAKLLKQPAYAEHGYLSRLNNGRILCLVVSFVVSALCMAGLLLEVPRWEGTEWLLAVVAIPLYLGVSLIVRRVAQGEVRRPFLISEAVAISGAIVAAVLAALYVGIGFVQPVRTFESASQAFLLTPQPFADSPSVLASELGAVLALVDGFTAYGISHVAEVSVGGFLVWKIVLGVSAVGAVVSLLGACSIPWSEFKRVFQPLDAALDPSKPYGLVRRNVVTIAVLPMLLIAAYLGGDFAAAQAAQTQEYTAAQRFVRDKVDLAVYVLDGAYYDYEAVQAVLEETRSKSQALVAEAQAQIVPLINASYDARIANVDAYLDWYYSLPADYERLVRLIIGSVEEYAENQFVEKIEAGVDDSVFEGLLQSYWDEAGSLKDGLMERLAGCEIAGIPDWLPVAKNAIEVEFLLGSLEPSEQFMSSGERLLASVGSGAASGVGVGLAAKHLVEKAVEKPFFKMVVSEITKRLGSRAVSSAIGGVVGVAGGPVGVAAGVVAGGAVGVGVDYGLLKLDEMWNREAYKAEIVQTIEDARAEMLAAMQG